MITYEALNEQDIEFLSSIYSRSNMNLHLIPGMKRQVKDGIRMGFTNVHTDDLTLEISPETVLVNPVFSEGAYLVTKGKVLMINCTFSVDEDKPNVYFKFSADENGMFTITDSIFSPVCNEAIEFYGIGYMDNTTVIAWSGERSVNYHLSDTLLNGYVEIKDSEHNISFTAVGCTMNDVILMLDTDITQDVGVRFDNCQISETTIALADPEDPDPAVHNQHYKGICVQYAYLQPSEFIMSITAAGMPLATIHKDVEEDSVLTIYMNSELYTTSFRTNVPLGRIETDGLVPRGTRSTIEPVYKEMQRRLLKLQGRI